MTTHLDARGAANARLAVGNSSKELSRFTQDAVSHSPKL